MQVIIGTVIDGKIVLNESRLPDGTVVTVYAEESGEPVRLSPDLQAELEAALEDADRHEGISADELLEQLKRYG